MKRNLASVLWNVLVYGIVTFVVVLMTLPFINIVALSFSSESAVLQNAVTFLPIGFNINTYQRVFQESQILLAMKNTVGLTLVGTAINMFMTILCAYPLSKSSLKGRTVFLGLITFTMIFHAGMIPQYMLIKSLNLIDTFKALWFSGAISTYNMIIMKSFFQSIPSSLEESAQIDGASEVRILVQIVLPLSTASIATISLFYAVGWWNSYFNNMLYITDSKLTTLQIQLRQLLSLTSATMMEGSEQTQQRRMTEESIKAVSIVIATVPILCVYPFLQKYFVKGVMIGSIKG